jgi:hypothetical protein
MHSMRLRPMLVFPLLVAAGSCRTSDFAIPHAWLSVPEAPRMRSVVLDENGKVSHRPQPSARALPDGPIHLSGGRLMNGEKALTEAFLSIDSFDYSESRGEVVFSARREGGFDIGLVSSDGSAINWVPSDPADELDVQWAPRGNKISYILRANGGDIIRTLHIPTSASLQVPFENATIHALAWDPAAERYAAAYSTPEASDRVDVLKYSGAERRTVISPTVRLDVEVEPFAPGAILLRPRDLRYGEKVPLVVWSASDFAWSDARAALIQNARVAVVVTTRTPSEALWSRVDATPWMDAKRTFVVGADAGRDGALQISGEQSVPGGRYRRARNLVTVSPAVVQSFAAGFIADQVKRTSPTNVSSR